MSSIISENLSNFIIPQNFNQEVWSNFKSLSREILQNISILQPEDYTNYTNSCVELRNIADQQMPKVMKWEGRVSSQKAFSDKVTGFFDRLNSPPNKQLIADFETISEEMLKNLEYVELTTLGKFQKISNYLKDLAGNPRKRGNEDQSATVQKIIKWKRVIAEATPSLQVTIADETLSLPPSSFKEGSHLHFVLRKIINEFQGIDEKGLLLGELSGIDSELMKTALQDPSKIIFTKDNIWDVLLISDFFKIKKLKKAVSDFAKSLSNEHLIDILYYSKKYQLDEVHKQRLTVLNEIED
jgi:hypothetical protein